MNTYPDLKNKTIKIKNSSTHPQVQNFGGSEILIEDLWKNVAGKSWMFCDGNPACIIYALRSIENNLPIDDAVYYGKIGLFGHLVHLSELEIE